MTDISQLEILERRLNEIGGCATLMAINGKVPMEPWKDWPKGKQVIGSESTALITGERSGVFVVDCDSKSAMERFLAAYPMVNTFVVQTKRGFHFYFAHPSVTTVPGVVPNSASKILPHVDVRGDGGYVAAPGSPDKSIVVDAPISVAPDDLLRDVCAKDIPRKIETVSSTPDIDGAIDFLRHSPICVSDGQGSGEKEMLRIAGHIKHLGVDEDTATALILEHCNGPDKTIDFNGNHCPWTREQIQHKVYDARAHPYPPPRGGDTRALNGLFTRVPKSSDYDYCLSRAGSGPTVRIPTGFPTFDESMRGGMQMGRIMVLGGAPGASKTATCLSIVGPMARAGHAVLFLASDEGRHGVMTRRGQMLGLSRDSLEDGDAEAWRSLAENIKDLNMRVLDNSVLEDAVGDLTKPTIVVVDSMQTQCVAAAEGVRERREQMNVVVKALKMLAEEGHMVIATSELSRGAYRNQKQAEETDPMAAMKETGSIEYAADVLLMLQCRQGSGTIVDARVGKNRLGVKKDFTLLLDFDHSLVTELRTAEAAIRGPLAQMKSNVINYLRAHPTADCISRNVLFESVGGGRKRFLQAVQELLDERQLTEDSKSRISLPHEVLTALST